MPRTRIRDHAKQVIRAQEVTAASRVFIGHWDHAKTYDIGDIVEYDNKIYEREDNQHSLVYRTQTVPGTLGDIETAPVITRTPIASGMPFEIMQQIVPSGREQVIWINATGADYYPADPEFHNTPIKAGGCAVWVGGDHREINHYWGSQMTPPDPVGNGIEVNGYLFMDGTVPMDWVPFPDYVQQMEYRDYNLQQYWAQQSGKDPADDGREWTLIGEPNGDANQSLRWLKDRQYLPADLVEYGGDLYVAKKEDHSWDSLTAGNVVLTNTTWGPDHEVSTQAKLHQVLADRLLGHGHQWKGTSNQLIGTGPEWHGFELHPDDEFHPEQHLPTNVFIDRGEIPGYPNTAMVNGWVIDDTTTRAMSGGFQAAGAVYIRQKVMAALHPPVGTPPDRDSLHWSKVGGNTLYAADANDGEVTGQATQVFTELKPMARRHIRLSANGSCASTYGKIGIIMQDQNGTWFDWGQNIIHAHGFATDSGGSKHLVGKSTIMSSYFTSAEYGILTPLEGNWAMDAGSNWNLNVEINLGEHKFIIHSTLNFVNEAGAVATYDQTVAANTPGKQATVIGLKYNSGSKGWIDLHAIYE